MPVARGLQNLIEMSLIGACLSHRFRPIWRLSVRFFFIPYIYGSWGYRFKSCRARHWNQFTETDFWRLSNVEPV